MKHKVACRTKRTSTVQMDQRGNPGINTKKKIPAEAWMYVSCECCVLSGSGLCDGPITRPEESYRVWCV
jgi:hypothetical protein